MIISFEVARQRRRGALPLHDTRIRQELLRTNQKQLPLSNRLQTRPRNDVAGKEPGAFERSTLLGNPDCRWIWGARPPFLFVHGTLWWSHLEYRSRRAHPSPRPLVAGFSVPYNC